jgi:general secretion pathway protein G
MTARTHVRQGFTLVEILIVVVILGILAAIVIPQFTNASQSAKTSSLQSQLQTIRSQLELFQVQHNGTYPDLTTSWSILTTKSDVAEVGPAAPSGTTYGPYLQQAPVNPLTNSNAVTIVVATPTPAATDANGWFYNKTTGAIWAAKFNEATGQSY